MEETTKMKYKAILVGEKVEPEKYPLVKQISGDTLEECKQWAKEILKDKKFQICVNIYKTEYRHIYTQLPIEPDKIPPACEVKS
jgi:hypothetical protein